jgi:hypothetical protein
MPAHYYESIDYTDAVNAVSASRRTSARDDPQLSRIKYGLTFIIGVCTGVVAWAIEGSTPVLRARCSSGRQR